MRALLPLLLCCAALAGCSDGSTAAPAKDGTSLRIVMRMHPDPQRMREELASRLGVCQLEQRAKGQPDAAPTLPNPSEIAKWVTRETEVLYAGNQRAEYATDIMVWPNADKGCQWTFYKSVTAETQTLCADSYGGSANAEPSGGAAAQAPRFTEDSTRNPQRCLADSSKKLRDPDLSKGSTPGGQPCLWNSDKVVNGEPVTPGQHFCVHPRAYDGSLPEFRGESTPTLRYLRILPPGVSANAPPEVDADRMEAEVIEEGKPIADDRFSRRAIEAFIKQPLIVPAGGSR
ncbi:hypothetical protein ACG02S_01715 [Roseateles sp. DC23W]|uniref:Lipoprotein n=1 Tax=Pelomonas dachongensis TaxID=3299029 RepID=A0ABW7EGW3_9BURK